mmetsp:Transcript_116563/g.249253  ORF Transcript_116563/g.249253 Transcript_116563/m.249253 type:complete len:220 (-) Transcript_116563:26-685(-)
MPDDGSPSRDAGVTVVEITFGTSDRTSRVDLKKRMSAFGEVDVCHMGNRGQDKPFVRYRTREAAEAAVKALKNGEVSMEDGALLAGHFKQGSGRRRESSGAPASSTAEQHRRRDETEDMTSRNLLFGGRLGSRAGSSPAGGSRRPRSRSHRRKSRSRRRSQSRSRREKKKRSHSRRADKEAPAPAPEEASGDAVKELEGNDIVGYANPLFMRKKKTAVS